MKKIFIAVIALFMGSTVFSQSVDFGVKFGGNFSNISDGVGMSTKTGFHAGLFAGIRFGKIGVQGDVLYSQQGSKVSLRKFDLDYVNVPITLKYYFVKGFNMQLGPQFGYMVGDSGLKDLNKTDISVITGLGYDFPRGLRLDARYNFGVTDVSKVAGAKGKNSVFSIALGYSFL